MTADHTAIEAIDDLLEQHADAAAAFQVDDTQQSLDRRMSAAERIRDLLAKRDATIAQLRNEVRTLTGTEGGIRVVLEAENARLREHSTWLNTISFNNACALGRVDDGQDVIEGNPLEQAAAVIAALAEARGQVAQLRDQLATAQDHQARFGKPGGPAEMTTRYETQYYYGPDDECAWSYWERGDLELAISQAERVIGKRGCTGAVVREYSVFTYHSDVKVLGSFGKVPDDEASGTTAGGDDRG